MTENEPTRKELEQRVEQLESELEATKSQQEVHQNRLQQIMPNRRQALKGLGILGAGGLLGAAGGSASASTGAAGQIGTDSDRPTIKADDLDANLVSTDEADIAQVAARIEATGSDQTIANGSTEKISFGNTRYADSDILTVDLPNNEIVIDVAGTYRVEGKITYTGSANWSDGDVFQAKLHINGSGEEQTDTPQNTNTANTGQVRITDEFSQNDTIDLRTLHNSGSDETVQSQPSKTNLEVYKVG